MRKFVFIADFFLDKVLGGAELSTEALIETCPGDVVRIKSSELTEKDVVEYKDATWIFTNVWQMKFAMIPYILRMVREHYVVEYDFKYCVYRSPDMHMVVEGIDCNCSMPYLNDFFKKAKHCFFMSQRQMDWHIEKIGPLPNASVLSSIFSNDTLVKLVGLSKEIKEPGSWAIVWSLSGLKGFNEAVAYAEKQKLNYYVLKGLNYGDMLLALARCEGLIYKPQGGDTCPRATIEALLMGLKLDLNYFVMHKDEAWFQDKEKCWQHLIRNKSFFWEKVVGYGVEKVGV